MRVLGLSEISPVKWWSLEVVTGGAFDCITAEAYMTKNKFPLLLTLKRQSVLKADEPFGLYLILQSAIVLQTHS